jgi:nucleoside-diphosphate kinase
LEKKNPLVTAERSLVLIKPDALHRGLAGEIISRLERKGLRIVAMKLLHMDKTMAEQHYAVHRGKPFFDGLVSFITSTPVIAMILQGKDAVDVIRQVMGSTDPAKAQPGTIRGDLAMDIGSNLIHGSDSPETAQEEQQLFFSEEEIHEYERDIDRWLV